MKFWQLFTKETTIHGVRFLTRHYKYSRYVWLLLLFASISLCSWQSAINIRDYFRFNVETAITYDTIDQLPFPAITFWNSNAVRRTVIGRNFEAEMLVSVIHKSDPINIHKTCSIKTKQRDYRDEIAQDLVDVWKRALLTLKIDGRLYMDSLQNYIQPTREMTFEKCWWKQDEVNCTENVLNTVIGNATNVLLTFSVNLHWSIVDTFQTSGLLFGNENYQQNDTMGTWTDGIGIESGYRFLLNVNADEYCYYQKETWYGVGIHAAFHERESFPDVSQRTIYLEPGYQYNIVLKPIHYSRQTEHLGRCLSQYPLYVFGTNHYAKSFCEMQCAFETVWKYCNCMSDLVESINRRFAKHHGLKNVTTCFDVDPTFRCIKENLTEEGTFATRKFCSHCKDPCEEMVYEYDVSAMAFPPKHLAKYYSEILNVSDEEMVRKNYLMVNVFFESKSINVITETQMYTVRDLFIYLGNNAGLFLGMSFMSFFEPVLAGIRALLSHMKQIWIKRKEELRRKRQQRRWMTNKVTPKGNPKIKIRTVQVQPYGSRNN